MLDFASPIILTIAVMLSLSLASYAIGRLHK